MATLTESQDAYDRHDLRVGVIHSDVADVILKLEAEIAALRIDLDDAHQHVGALLKSNEAAVGMADAITAYFNKRGAAHSLKTGNDDIMALGEALSEFGPTEPSLSAARTWLRRRG